MTERLLQYIWQFQYYNRNDLTTASGEQLAIIHPGMYNTNQGPDFIEGRIRVGVNTWIGNIELHVNASDWHRHQHADDRNYHNVILHVVWNNDDTSLGCFQTLVLSDRVPRVLLQQYETWMKGDYFIPCETSIGETDKLVWTSWKERLMIERFERRFVHIHQLLKKSKFDWEETFWWMVARNFGLFVNADAFLEIASSIPYNVLRRHRTQIHQLEAILFGQAGLLNAEFVEHYPAMLKKEYSFLQKKYKLQQVLVAVHFLRMRPACFPTIRLAQLDAGSSDGQPVCRSA